MSVKSPKIKSRISQREMYYVSRNIFLRNKSYIRDFSMDGLIVPQPNAKRNSVNITQSLYSPLAKNDLVKQEKNFERFFLTSVRFKEKICDEEYSKQRERFLHSRERQSLNCSFVSTSSSFKEKVKFLKSQGVSLNASQDLTKNLRNSIQLKSEILHGQDANNNKPSRKLIILQDSCKVSARDISHEGENDMMNVKTREVKLDDSPSSSNQGSPFRRAQSIVCQEETASNQDGSLQKFQSKTIIKEIERSDSEQEQITQRMLTTELERRMVSQEMDRIMISNQWKNTKQSSPTYSFYKNSARKSIFDGSTHLIDDEMRFNNFEITQPNTSRTMSIEKITPRDYKVFKQNKINDLQYAKSGNQYEHCIYNNKTLKCTFQLNKTENDSIVGRAFYRIPRKDDVPATVLDQTKVIAAKNKFLPFRRSTLPRFDLACSRETPASSPFCLLKDNENPYAQEKKIKNMKSKTIKFKV